MSILKTVLKTILKGFLLPGTMFLSRIGVSIEEDGGVMRSFINMCFWGIILMWIVLTLYT
jgi:FtsH-binding integral membrane protein